MTESRITQVVRGLKSLTYQTPLKCYRRITQVVRGLKS